MVVSPRILPFGIMFLASYGVPAVMPVFPLMRDIWNLSPEQVSLMVSVFALPGLVVAPLSGVLIDRLPRKLLVLIAVALYISGGFYCGISQSYSGVLWGRFFQGLGQTPMMIIANALAADMCTGSERAKFMGQLHAVTCVGIILFPLLAGFCGLYSWRLCFILPAVLSLPMFFLCWYLPMPEAKPSSMSLKIYLGHAGRALKSPQILLVLVMCVLETSISNGAIMAFYPLYANDTFAALSSEIGGIYSLALVGMLIGALTLSASQRLLGTPRMIVLVSAVGGLSMVAFTHMPSLAWLLLPLFAASFADGLMFPAFNYSLATLSNDSVRAAVLSINILGFRLSQTLSPLIFSLCLSFWGYASLYYVAGAFLFAISLFAAFAMHEPAPIADDSSQR